MNKFTIILLVIGLVVIGGGVWAYSNYVKYAPTTYIKETRGAPVSADTTINTENTSNDTAVQTTTSGSETSAPVESIKPTTVTTVDTTTGTVTQGAPTYTMAQVAAHADTNSCYSVISGIVYDLTMWVNMHPGGKGPITFMCGKDGTNSFMNKHHGAQKQMDILARFKIGLLTQ